MPTKRAAPRQTGARHEDALAAMRKKRWGTDAYAIELWFQHRSIAGVAKAWGKTHGAVEQILNRALPRYHDRLRSRFRTQN